MNNKHTTPRTFICDKDSLIQGVNVVEEIKSKIFKDAALNYGTSELIEVYSPTTCTVIINPSLNTLYLWS